MFCSLIYQQWINFGIWVVKKNISHRIQSGFIHPMMEEGVVKYVHEKKLLLSNDERKVFLIPSLIIKLLYFRAITKATGGGDKIM